MTGLGERLKAARIEKGFTLDDLQSTTKIQKRYLENIENENFTSMPGAFYVRAFIKQYAEAVGLDPEEMLGLYREQAGETEEQVPETKTVEAAAKISRSKMRTSSTSRLTEMMPKFIVALFIIVIIAVVYFLMINSASKKQPTDLSTESPITVQDQEKPKTEEKVEETTEEKPATDEEEIEEKPIAQKLTFENARGEDMVYQLEGTPTFKLEIRTSEDSWIGVLDSNQVERMPAPKKAAVYGAGEKVEVDVSDTESVRIRVGRTSATEIYVNGEKLSYESELVTQNIIIEYAKE